MRILLADDQTDIRSALRLLLEQDDRPWQVIQEVENFSQLLQEVELLQFDLVLWIGSCKLSLQPAVRLPSSHYRI
jgi:DNA-binding NarL/FixJ family response regulator